MTILHLSYAVLQRYQHIVVASNYTDVLVLY